MTSYDNILHAFRRSAARHGPRTAFERGAATVTYAQLEARSDALAGVLAADGAAPGSTVGILADDPAEVTVGILGALKAARAFVPLSAHLPRARLDAMLAAAAPGWIVAGEGFAAHAVEIAPAGTRVAALGADSAESDGRVEHVDDRSTLEVVLPEPGGPDDMAYVYFTSGSTGQPKGIAGRHKAIDHFVRWETEALGLGEGVRVSQLTTPVFDAFLRDVFVPLCNGGTVCAPPSRELVLDGAALAAWLEEARVEVLHCVPSVFRSVASSGLDPERLPHLRWVLTAGEPLLPGDVKRWTGTFGERARLVNLYGPSETTMVKLAHFVTAADGERRTVPIGRPMPGAAAVVLDARGRPCPRGTIGEIYIRTPFRSLGYLNDPERTAEVFVPNPLTGDAADVVYRTGDYGRVLDDGSFEFLGRRDHQVKVRGVRVETAEVENALRAYPGVRDAAVADRAHPDGSVFLCAYVVADGEVDAEKVRAFLGSTLPPEYLPSAFVAMDALPRTITGKVDRRALPAPGADDAQRARPFVAPRMPTEETLAAVWRELLGIARIGVDDHFFELGGHSLLATRVLARVREAFGVEMPLAAFFAAPTVAGLAGQVEARVRARTGAEAPPLVPARRDRPLPLSFAQQRLWFIDQLDPGTPAYNLPVALRLRGPLDAATLERAIGEVVRRHEVLRTTFHRAGDGQAVQVVGPAEPFSLARIDLAELPVDDRQAQARRLAADEAARPFDLARGPLLRGTLARLDEDDHVLLFTMHHVVSDGWSTGVLTREVSALYAAFAAGRPSPLAELPVQYGDFAVWQRGWLKGEALRRQLDFWSARLAGAPPLLELPTDGERGPLRTAHAASRPFHLDAGTVAALRALAREEGATLYMALLAAFQAVLGRWAGQTDVVVGSPVAGRTHVRTEELIGLFANTLAMRADLSADPSFRALLGRVRDGALEAFAHQDLPFERLVEELRVERSLTHTPVFQAVFALQNVERASLGLGEVQVEALPAGESLARFDLQLLLTEQGDGVSGELTYRTDLWSEATADAMLRHLARLVEGAVADPARPLSRIDLAAPDEAAALARAGRGGAEPFPDLPIHTLFERQAVDTPGTVAVSQGDVRVTYAELDGRADRIARLLVRRGVGAETRVGLCMDRSPEMVAATLGILKAGGAFVPLDPAYPAERLEWMAADASLALAVTTRALRGHLPESLDVLCLDDAPGENDVAESEEPRVEVDPDGLAYVMYTSGSTGTPKGVAVPHRAVVRLVRGSTFASFALDEVFLQMAPTSFDAATFEIWGALLNGARLALLPAGTPSLAELAAQVAQAGVTTLWLTAGLFHQVVDGHPELLSGVRQLLAGGDALSPAHVRRLREAHPGLRLVNGYGPTENTTFTCCHAVDDAAGATVPIGIPIGHTFVRVLDAHGVPVPAGVPGELHAGGAGLARGYLGRPALTAERFVPDPLAEQPGARLYRTGDRVRWNARGRLEFLGRMDGQVKVRGFRVEPGEVEAALRAHPAVARAAVAARPDAAGEKRLVAWAVAAPGAAPSGEELRAHLAARLPAHLVPAAVVLLAELPLTANGKVDHRALPDPTTDGAAEGYVPPATPAEAAMAELWEELLGVQPVGVEDDFFSLGGHSLLAVRLMTRVRRQFGVELPLSALFTSPTVRGLAALLGGEGEEAPTDAAASPLVAIQPGGSRVPLFFVHPIGGQVLCYADLARALGPDQPFYALQAPDLTAVGDGEESIEQMAARYVRAVREAWPHGPYLLGGWSFGGFVAFEMAQQLTAAGHEVPLLAILDTASPEGGRKIAAAEEHVRLAHMAHEEALKAGRRVSVTAQELRDLSPDARVERVLGALREQGVVSADVDARWVRRILDGMGARLRSMARYQPRVYAGRIDLFLPEDYDTDADTLAVWGPDSALGWRDYASEPVVMHVGTGHHATMAVGEHAHGLARRLGAVIEETLYDPCP